MGRKKLSVRAGEELTPGWFGYNDFDDTQISNIQIIDSRTDKSLNAIPSPLARIHLFDAAFSLVYQDESQGTNYSGYAYKKLVSDCFDVFEIIYNWKYHKEEGKSLSFLIWNKDVEINNLEKIFKAELKRLEDRPRTSTNSRDQINLQSLRGFKTNLVGKTLNLFLNQADFIELNDFFILKYDHTVIAGISPFTGFFTTPNDLSNLDLTNPFTRKKYFEGNPRAFADRNDKIKKYIYDFFQKNKRGGGRIFSSELAINEYLSYHRRERNIDNSVVLNLEPLEPQTKIFDNAVTIETCKDRNDYLEKYLIKLNYKINDECFYTVSNLNSKRNYDYLLPLSPAFFSDFIKSEKGFDAKKISSLVVITEKGDKTVEVAIKVPGGKQISKTYRVDNQDPLDGELLTLSDGFGLNLSLSLFPNVIIEDNFEMNDYFKIMLGLKSKDKKFSNKDIQLSFYTNNKKIEEDGHHIKCTQLIRTELNDNFFGSSYFELNGKFDFIQLAINSDFFGGSMIFCSIVPKWNNRSKLGEKKFKCAIDFGTTTTFVGLRDKENKEAPVALSIESQNELLVAHFHNPKEVNTTQEKQNPFDYEVFDAFNEFAALEIKEFLPVIIGSAAYSKYKFPLRTAICELNNSSSSLSALSNANIAFGYEKISLTDKHQSFKTNLKWSVEGKTENRIKIFLEELAKIIKYKIIRNGGNPYFTDVIWFYPLSFADWNKRIFGKIWKEIFEKEFKDKNKLNSNGSDKLANVHLTKNEGGRLIELTESEAPIHFHKVNANLKELTKILSIDIGGGSTDIVYYHSGGLKIGSSFNFATNLLWSDGNIRLSNSRANGIFNEFASNITNYLNDKSSSETDKRRQAEYFRTKLINTDYLDNLSHGSDDIINFWLSNNEQTNFTNSLSRSQYRLNFLFFFSAIIYHTAQLLKSKGDDKRPACICLSGNGSKVVDLITDDVVILSKICKYLINAAFDLNDNNYFPQVILPRPIERKEATCFGGLYEDEISGRPTKSTYLGMMSSEQESFKNVEHYKEITSALENSVYANVKKFIEVFKKMNSEINFKNEFGLDVPLDALGNFMVDNINRNYQFEKDRKASETKPDETINDSPFFWALKGLLFDLSILDASKLDVYRNKIDLFFERPTVDGEFTLDKISKSQLDSSLYKVEIEDEHSNNGKLYLLTESEYTLKTALSNTEANLLPVCNYNKLPNASTTSIRVINYGVVENINNSWAIRKKIEIEFI